MANTSIPVANLQAESRQLVRLAKSGDRLALQRLLVANANPTCRHIRSLLPKSFQGMVDAEDILQQAFMDAFRDIRQLNGDSSGEFLAWLKAIAEHRLQDTIRAITRAKRGGRPHAIPVNGSNESLLALVELLSSDGRSPSYYVAKEEVIAAVQQSIRDLPDDYRRAVELRFLEGKGLAEVAVIMNRTPRAIQGLLDRARKTMREALEGLSL